MLLFGKFNYILRIFGAEFCTFPYEVHSLAIALGDTAGNLPKCSLFSENGVRLNQIDLSLFDLSGHRELWLDVLQGSYEINQTVVSADEEGQS